MSRIKLTKASKVRNYAKAHPDATTAQIAKATRVHISYVYNIVSHDRKRMDAQKHIDEMNLLHTSTSNKSLGDIAHRVGTGRVIEVPVAPTPKTWLQRIKSFIFP
jgi:hypothetical protein